MSGPGHLFPLKVARGKSQRGTLKDVTFLKFKTELLYSADWPSSVKKCGRAGFRRGGKREEEGKSNFRENK